MLLCANIMNFSVFFNFFNFFTFFNFTFYYYLCSMKLSVIVPVYGVEGTLERCVESILSQSFRDLQLILVDDCSPDRCPQLCDKLAAKDARVVVRHRRENGGLSAARNTGLARAKGEYVTFVDSDDYLGADTLKPLMELLAVHHEYDLLEYSVYEHYGWPGHMNILRLDDRAYTDMHDYWYTARAYEHTYACNKIYKKELFDGLTFPEGRKFEDAYMLPLLLERAYCVATTSLGWYYYCHNPKGITMQAGGEELRDLLQAHLKVLQKDSNSPLAHPTAHYYGKVLNVALDVCEATGEVADLPRFKQVCNHPDAGKAGIKVKALNILGLKNLCRTNKLLHCFSKRGR